MGNMKGRSCHASGACLKLELSFGLPLLLLCYYCTHSLFTASTLRSWQSSANVPRLPAFPPSSCAGSLLLRASSMFLSFLLLQLHASSICFDGR